MWVQEEPDACRCPKGAAQRDLDPKTAKRIGLFLVPAPAVGILEWKTVIVENISYEECAKRGENCEAYQWIPHVFVWSYPDKSGKSVTVTISSKSDLPKIPCQNIQPFCP
jgi:hypothetical protein